MSSITGFNRVCGLTENVLSGVSAFVPPVAICKFALGTIQTVTALALGILSLPFRFCSEDAKVFNDHCWTHAVHGLGNVVASLVEAIPFVGLVLLTIRADGIKDNDFEQQTKYIPYSNVVQANRANQNSDSQTYKDLLYTNTKDPAFLSPTHFRQATGFNAIRV